MEYEYKTYEWCDGFAFGSLIGVNKELFGNRLICGYGYDYYPNFYTIINHSEAYIYYLNKLGEFYRVDLLKSKYYYTINEDKIYSIDLDQVDEQPNLYISQPQPINIISSGLTSSDCSLTFSRAWLRRLSAAAAISACSCQKGTARPISRSLRCRDRPR